MTNDADATERTLRSVAGTDLRREISGILREAIWNGTLRPGQRLNELWLAQELQVSRPPLREAMRVLEQDGLVESRPRRGSYVKVLSGQDVLEIYTLRCAIEGMAAELVIQQEPQAAIGELEQHIHRVEAEQDLAAIIREDLEFHRTLVRMSGNSRLVRTWEQIAGQLRLALTLVDPGFFEMGYVETTHRALVKAIEMRNVEEAWRLVRTLLDVGRDLKERWER